MDAYRISGASLIDLAGVYRLERVCFGEDAWSLPDLVITLLWPGQLRLRVMAGKRFIGFAMGEPVWREGISMITTIGIDPEFQRQGVASALLAECESRLPGECIRLTVREDNEPAIQLYKKFGYQQKARLADYYRNGRAGILMEKSR